MAVPRIFSTGVRILSGLVIGRVPLDTGHQPATVLPLNSGTFTANGATPVAVAETNVTANSNIVVTLKTVGGTVGAVPAIQTITPGAGFTIAATAGDTSVYNYLVIG